MTRALHLAAVALLAAMPAQASVLQLEGSTLEILVPSTFVPLTGFEALSFPQVVSVPVFVSSGTGGFTLPGGIMSGTETTQFPPTSVSLLTTQIWNVTNGAGSLAAAAGIGGAFGGIAPLAGTLVWRSNGSIDINIPLNVVGAGGVATGSLGSLVVTVTGHAWSTGQVVVSGVTGASAITGFDTRTVAHAGALQLVTPIRAITSALGTVPMFAVQTLHFVPEPGVPMLLALAGGAAWAVGRRVRQR